MNSILEILNHTPVWVWVILVVLIKIGIKGLSTHNVTIVRVIITPIAFLLMFSSTKFSLLATEKMLLIVSIISGVIIGYIIINKIFNPIVKVDKQNKNLEIKGSPMTLIMIVLVFTSNYMMNVLIAYRDFNSWYTFCSFLSFAGNGFIWYRAIYYLYSYYKG